MRSSIVRLFGFVCTAVVIAAFASPAAAQIAFRDEEATGVDNLSSISIARPGATLEFDLMIAAIAVRNGTGTTITPPAGWTLIRRTDNGTTLSVATYYRLAGTAVADPGPYVFTFNAGRRATGSINVYENVHGTTPVNISGGNTGSATSVVAPSVTTTVANTLLLTVFSRSDGNGSFTQPVGMTERNDVSSGAGPNGAAAATDDQAIAAIGVTNTRTATSSNGPFVAQSIALTPSLCGNGMIDAGEQCDDSNTTAGDCCSPVCQFESAATECRTSAGACDPAETCTGSSATCPADAISPNGTACGSPGDSDCDNPDTCDGVSTACQSNNEAADTLCGDPSDTECTNPDTCNASGTCLANDAGAGTACGDPSDTECTSPDTCNGGGACLANHAGSGSACGDPSDTECTNPDTCNGSGSCLVNDAAAGSSCGDPSNTECTNPDTCNGGGACLANHAGSGTACGDPSDTECTNPDTCNGGGTCAANDAAAGTSCGDPGNTECTNPDTCNGTGACQLNDAANGTACGDPTNNDCANPDTCTAGACQSNDEAAGTACGDPSDTECANPDTCNATGTCLSNDEAAGSACGDPTNSDCTNPDTCNASGACLVNDEAAGFACGDPSDTDCTNADTCNGSGACQENDEAAGFACGDGSDTDCTNPDTCNGTGSCQANNEATGFACGDPSNTDCTNPDTCDGSGACLVNDEAAGFTCGDPSDSECTDPDTCDGSGSCQANQAASGATCGDASDTDCTNPDSCDGAGACQPNDEAAGFTCGDGSDTDCTNSDSCNGMGTCDTNNEPAGTACGNPADTDCSNPDTCDAGGVCLTNDEAAGFTCGDPADTDCSNPDTCNGTGTCQVNDEADGFACGDATDTECSNPDACAAGVCSANHEPAGTSCRPVAGTCDAAETCDGSSPTCPADVVLTAGTPCRPASGLCDAEEQCDGTLATCPSDLFAPDGTICDDGQACTTPDMCTAGLCQGESDAEGCADDFLCYKTITAGFVPIQGVDLADEFESQPFIAKSVMHLCTPADEGSEGTADATTHLTSYGIKIPKGDPAHVKRTGLVMRNQFGDISIDTIKPDLLFVPSAVDPMNPPTAPDENGHNVNHYKCYKVKVTKGTTKFPLGVQVTVADEFTATKTFDVKRPKHLCVPVDTEGVEIKNPEVQLMCYLAKPALGQPKHVKQTGLLTADQLGARTVGTIKEMELCVPSLRLP